LDLNRSEIQGMSTKGYRERKNKVHMKKVTDTQAQKMNKRKIRVEVKKQEYSEASSAPITGAFSNRSYK
jgi:hypothetical protein